MLASGFRELGRWTFGRPDVFESTFERLTFDPIREFGAIFGFLGVPVPPTELTRILERWSFATLRQRHPGHYRNGHVAQWRTALPPDLLGLFMRRHGALVEALGYPTA